MPRLKKRGILFALTIEILNAKIFMFVVNFYPTQNSPHHYEKKEFGQKNSHSYAGFFVNWRTCGRYVWFDLRQ